MSCTRSPPPSPRAPKIQQQSWDDCGTPPIDLYDPALESPPRSPSRYDQPPKSPKSPRKFDKKFNMCFEAKSPKSPRKFDFSPDQRGSPKFDYSIGDGSGGGGGGSAGGSSGGSGSSHKTKAPKLNRNYSKNSSGSGGGGGGGSGSAGGIGSNSSGYYYEERSPKYYDKSPKSPRKFDYEAISPKHHDKGKKFEYFELDDHHQHQKNVSKYMKKQQEQQQQHHQSVESGGNIQSPATTSTPISENFNYEKRNSAVAESTISADSAATTAILSSSSGIGGCGDLSCGSHSSAGGAGDATRQSIENHVRDNNGGTEGHRWDNKRRRHAINITSNPGYQVLHSSHSTLDRTCSDGVMSVKCRKSTSDLTNVTEANTPVPATPRRRGSSKGGLAYLASRRESRDSIKSAVSNASIFSNEDLGPLAFQSSTRGRQRRTSNFLELPVPDHIRPRVCSLPERPYNPRQSDDLYRLRTFSISKGTVVNCGDSIISRRSRSNTSVNSTTSRASDRSPFDGSCCGGGYTTVDSLPPSPTDSEPPPPPRYRVIMLGDTSVGKTALVSQFMTSEYMHTYDASLDDEFGEKTVSILLDGEESEMIFIDHPSTEMSVENSLSTYEPHGCVVIYSVVARSSFKVAEEIITYLAKENVTRDKAVILVGNKADLARSRVIPTTEGKLLAASNDVKFIETSSGIQHHVDELLVGILKQIRLKETRDKKAAVCATKMRNSKTHMSLHLAKEILQKICLSDISKSKSCENLHVL